MINCFVSPLVLVNTSYLKCLATGLVTRFTSCSYNQYFLQNINPCPDFPVVYNLVLKDFEGNRTSHVPDFSDDRISIFVVILAEDTLFRFYIEAMNQFGISALTPIEIGM